MRVGPVPRNDGKAGQDGKQKVAHRRSHTGQHQVLVLFHIGRIGDDNAGSQGQGEERLPQRIDESVGRHLGEIGLQQVFHALESAGKRSRIHHQEDNEDKQRGNAPFAELLNAVLDPEGHHRYGYAQKSQVKHNRKPGPGNEALKSPGQLVRSGARKIQMAGLDQIVYAPASHHGVVRHNPERGEHHQKAEHLSHPAGYQKTHRGPAVGLAAASDGTFGQKDRQGKNEGESDVNENKGGASVFSYQIGKSPNVSQPNGATGKSGDDGHAAAEVFS